MFGFFDPTFEFEKDTTVVSDIESYFNNPTYVSKREALQKALKESIISHEGHLNLPSIGLGDMGITELVLLLKEIPELAHLDLTDNQIGNEGAKALVTLVEGNPSIESLNLTRNNISRTMNMGDGAERLLSLYSGRKTFLSLKFDLNPAASDKPFMDALDLARHLKREAESAATPGSSQFSPSSSYS